MKSADIKVGETYSFVPSKYATPVPVMVLAVGRYNSYRKWQPGDKPQPYYTPVVVVERETRQGDRQSVVQLNVPPGQIKGLWIDLAPIYTAEQQAARARAAERKRVSNDRARRWTEVTRRLEALGLEFEVSKWRSGDLTLPIQLDTIEGLLALLDEKED